MKRPLAAVAIVYAAGIVLAELCLPPPRVVLGAALVLAITALLWTRWRSGLLALLLLFTGAANQSLHQAILSPCDLRLLLGDSAHNAVARGRLRATPEQRQHYRDEELVERVLAELDVEQVHLGNGPWTPACGTVVLNSPGHLTPRLFGGQAVEVAGVLAPPPGPVAPGTFDYRTYLRRRGIHYQLRAGLPGDWQLVPPVRPPGLSDRFTAWAKATLARGLPEQDEPLRLLWAMTLGWKTALNDEVSEPFMRSGTMHIFAISGLHIALIAGILSQLLRVCRLPQAVCGLIVLPLIWLYTGVTGWQASAIRSTIMMSVIIGGWALKRPSDLLNSLSAAAFVILLWDPQQLFQASFQLSFFVVLSLALFSPWLDALRQRWLEPDPLLPAELRPRWQRLLERGLWWSTGGFMTSLAAWLGSMPLVAYYFHLFTPVSLLANLIVVPLSSLALAANLGSLIVGGWWPALGELFNHSAWLWMYSMVTFSEGCASLPGGWFHVGAPSFLTFVLYYALLIAVTGGWLKASPHRSQSVILLCLLALGWAVEWAINRTHTRLTVLPLSGGHALHWAAPGRDSHWLIDCGDETGVRSTTLPFLRGQGVNQLGCFVLTHGDARHVRGAELVRSNLLIARVLLSPARFRSAAYRQVRAQVEQTPHLLQEVQAGETLPPWTVLHPTETDRFPLADDNALVLRGELRGTRVLLLSDLGRSGQEVLLERANDLKADIVVAGLPAQGEPLADAVLEAVRPRLIILADASYPATARASQRLRQRLRERGLPVFYTSETQAVTLSFHRDGWTAETSTGARASFRHGEWTFKPTAPPAPPRSALEE